MNIETQDGKVTARVAAVARMQRYRAKHRRIDYVPGKEALVLIERHLAEGLDNCVAGVIDRLIAAGDRAATGNGKG